MIAVVHIHKTAGTTLASVFKRSYGRGHLDVRTLDPDADHLTSEQLRTTIDRFGLRLRSLNGHAVRAYAGLEAVIPDIDYITFVRDPVERTASHYQYDVQRGGVDLPFSEWVSHDVVPNRMTRILAGPGATGEDAISYLDRFAFVGRSDRFDESLVLMRDRLGIPDIRYRSRWVAPSNEIKRTLLEDPGAVEQLEAVNREDRKVWEYAVHELYPKQEAEFGRDLADAVAEFRRRNSQMTKWRTYANWNYARYVAFWRFRYRPWIRTLRGEPDAG
jgi:hypothetical protein